MFGDEVRHALVVGLAKRGVESVEREDQGALCGVRDHHASLCRRRVARFAQNAFNPHRLVQQIRTGLALEADEAIQIEHVARRARVREIGELERGDRDFVRDFFELRRRKVAADLGFGDPCARFVHGHFDQIGQAQHAAGARLERFAVGAVHRAEADVFERRSLGVARERGGAKHLLEMVGLALIDDVKTQIRIDLLSPLDDGREIRRAVHRRPFRRDDEQRRRERGVDHAAVVEFLLFGFAAGDVHDQSALVLHEEPFGAQIGHHVRNVRIGVRFAVPEVEIDIEGVEVTLLRRHRQRTVMRPDLAIAGGARLQARGRFAGAVAKRVVVLRAGRGLRIDRLQIVERDRVELRARFTRRRRVGIDRREAFFEVRDQKPHLEAPVAEMRIAPHAVAAEAEQPLDALADDRRAQMAHMHRLGDVGTAVIDDDASRCLHR